MPESNLPKCDAIFRLTKEEEEILEFWETASYEQKVARILSWSMTGPVRSPKIFEYPKDLS